MPGISSHLTVLYQEARLEQHPVVVGGVGEGDGQEALLLEVSLVDAGKGLDEDGAGAQVARLERGVLTAGAFAVVVIAHHDPLQALGLVVARHRRNCIILASGLRTCHSYSCQQM